MTGTAESDPVKSASELDYPPFSIVLEDGRADGFSVELMRAALQAMNRDVTFKTGAWPVIKQELEKGRLDALPLVGRTPEREALFDFTIPYISLYGAVFVRDGKHDIANLQDLMGLSIGVLQGDNAEEFLHREGFTENIVATKTYEEAFLMLAGGEIDSIVAQRLVGLTLIDKLGLKNIETAIAPLTEFKQDFCFAVADGDKELLALLNEGLSLIIANGTYDHLREKWLGILDRKEDERVLTLQIATGATTLLALIVIGLFIYYHWREHYNLKFNEEKFRTLFENMAQGAFFQRVDGVLLDINSAGLKLLGVTYDQFIGKTSMDPQWRVIREDGTTIPGDQHPSMQALLTGKPVRGAIVGVYYSREKRTVWLNITAIPQFKPEQDRPYQVFVTMHDISKRKQTEETLKQQAIHDPLTGLYNRSELERRLEEEAQRSIRYNHELSLFMIDIDHFKQINDQYGHPTGDQVLRQLTSFIDRNVRKTDYAARFGGEEFVIVLPETPFPKALELAERLCRQIAGTPLSSLENGKTINLTISIGVATMPEHAKSWDDLLSTADTALYAAKRAGRNQVMSA
ncbi:MAG: diguanylate cyclase [Candidatus Thiodiazotropha weberae]|nr:diguanylate cyclase [Candidatus Thiodiazotropha weberae]